MATIQGMKLVAGDFFSRPLLSLDPRLRLILVNELWPQTQADVQPLYLPEFDAYFDYLFREQDCALAEEHAITSFEDLILICRILKADASASLADILVTISHARPTLTTNRSKIVSSIELAVQLWLMFVVRNLMPTDRQHLETSLPWPDTMSLQSVMRQHIKKCGDMMGGKFNEFFNVSDMKNIANVRIQWTNNLASHLLMKGSVIFMFHNVSVLKRMRDSSDTTQLLPRDFIDETLATIDLLIPFTRSTCNGWLSEEIKRLGLDGNIVHRNPPSFEKVRYPYWQERLITIEESFEKTKPRKLFQWWYDKRDTERWWGFWLVVIGIFLTVLFGLIQSVTGIIQVVKAG